jgi:uncharacterized protein HemX
MQKILLVLILATSLVSCASHKKKQIEQEKAQVGSVSSNADMARKTREMLDKSDKLTQQQKDDFMRLHDKVIADVQGINEELRKTKIVMFDNLLNDKYDVKKMELLQSSIRKLMNQKMDVMTRAMVEGKKILGVNTRDVYKETFLSIHYDHLR